MKKTAYFLLLCFTAFLFSCSEDDLNKSHDHDNHAEFKIKKNKVSFQDMKSHLLRHTGSSLPASLDTSLNKGSDGYITAIDTTSITLITDGNVSSFTLHINTLDDELYAYSNLVIKSYNGQTEEFIYHYNPTGEWQSAFDAGEKLPYDGEFMITDINGNETGEISNKTANCPIAINAPCYGPSCPCTDGEGMTVWIPAPCPGGGGSSEGGGNPGNNGPLNPGGFPPTDPNQGGSSYTDFDYFLRDLDNDQKAWLIANPTTMGHIYTFLENNNYNNNAYQVALELVEFLEEENGIKDKLRQAIANGITTTAEYTHKVFKKFSQLANQYPSSITVINTILNGVRYGVNDLVNTNPNTCSFADLFNMWLFELGPNPINFNGFTHTTNQLLNQEGVNQARDKAIIQIQNGNFATIHHSWNYGQGEFYDGMQNGNFVTAFLGTYTTKVTITPISNGYQLNFHVTNPSSWESATRFRIDNDNNGNHDGIFPNTSRTNNNDISLGGTFTQNWYWTEIVN